MNEKMLNHTGNEKMKIKTIDSIKFTEKVKI